MAIDSEFKKSLEELRKEKERKFDQSLDLIINLQKFDPKRNSVNLFISVPHRVKDKKIAAFLESVNGNVETVTREEFGKYSDKKEMKNLVKNFDFFIAQASLMPSVATTFGRVLGPVGKMPSPQLGIVANVNDREIENLKNKINTSIKIRTKEPSIKVSIGKHSMKDEDIVENALSVYNAVLNALPRNRENVKNVELKFTMSKPVKVEMK